MFIFQLSLIHNEEEYNFNLNNHVILNNKNDSWTELPVFKEDESEMIPGNTQYNQICKRMNSFRYPPVI